MLIKSEKQLLSFIKYSPVLIITLIAILINILIYVQNEENFQKDLKIYKKNYIESKKRLTKFQVEKAYKDIQRERDNIEQRLENRLKSRVQEAYNIIKNLHEKYSHLEEKELLNIIKESLRPIRFNEGRGYFYLVKNSGITILHPIIPQQENKDSSQRKDENGNYLYKDILEHFKTHDEYFGELKAVKPDIAHKRFDKVSYIKLYKPLDILIGTGEYKEDFLNEMKNHIIKEYIQNIRYGKNGYIFIFDYDGYQLAHIKKEYIGKKRIDLVDSNGFMITKEIIKQAKKGPGFINYIGSIMPETGKPAYKTTYIIGIDDWGWAIGSGFYNLDMLNYLETKKKELRQMNNESLKNTLVISLILCAILIALSFYVSNILEKFFTRYHERIENEILENRKKDMVLYQQSKMASMGEMLGNIAHQWRQPLSSVSTIASGTRIQKELGMLDDKEFDKGMETIVNTTKHLSQTIDDFREFFNPNRIKEEISTQTLYNKAIQLISSRLTTKEIELKSNIDDANFVTYENELLQGLMNILNNAIDAFENKHIKNRVIEFNIKYELECKMPSCAIEECTQGKEGYITITIQDNAGGIQEDNLDKIFDAYFTTKHKSQGTGIGLYMTYEIINKHLKGFISVENSEITYNKESYKGAKFTIILPTRIEEG
ncbi:histidine kinase [Arcobacter sp. CECT 8983]|uniref:sensor histidine kinase n=1 Tax=Arcobacter sp. CECT 8983 TaxID=2044508 RepID=UPI00100B2CEA|nr:cache domain-containing protein [Arcobacter sp. CECT 8983]RXJ91760.1 histidine kinase [Arcobacter sp. CECT 8983]